MMQPGVILNLKEGEVITVTGNNGCLITLSVNLGDALLNGDKNQVWLENSDEGNRSYLRRMPEKRMSIGPALFTSLEDLATVLESGNYYIG